MLTLQTTQIHHRINLNLASYVHLKDSKLLTLLQFHICFGCLGINHNGGLKGKWGLTHLYICFGA
jgi:hypothetical protein